MNFETVKQAVTATPALVVDLSAIKNALGKLAEIRSACQCKILYSIKALPLDTVLNIAKPTVDGFSVSSLFEARLAREILGDQGSVHLTTPGLRLDEWHELSPLLSHISFNSLPQYQRFQELAPSGMSLGLRINPKLSLLTDARFDPCRPHSKLGVDVKDLKAAIPFTNIRGLHFHNSFSATRFSALMQTVELLQRTVPRYFAQLHWLNFGGGYLFDQLDCAPFVELVRNLKTSYGLDIYIEPGKAIVGNAGYLITTVLDVFVSDGKTIAVLDTSVNHHPEVFEYQRQPELHEHDPQGGYSALLAGSTCLAGDLFGEYRFQQPINVGDKLIFKHLGAYSLIKANRFNGYNLPDLYAHASGQVTHLKHYPYQAYREQWLTEATL